jgi:Type VI secretion system VasI, EvfG, VC_A0118
MMWTRPTGTILFLASGIIGAHSANDGVSGLESCFQVARIADSICSKLPDDPARRLDCFQKTRTAQLECLEHVLSEARAAPPPAPQGSSGSEAPPVAAEESRSKDASPKQSDHAGPTTTSSEINQPRDSNNPPPAVPKTNPVEQPSSSQSADAALERPSKDDALQQTPGTGPTMTPTGRPQEPDRSSAATAKANPPEPSPPTTPPSGSKRSSGNLSIKPTGGTTPPAASAGNHQRLESDRQPNTTAGTKEKTESQPALPSGPSGDAAPPKQAGTAPAPATNAMAAGSPTEVLPKQPGDTPSPVPPMAGYPPQDSKSAPTENVRASLPQRPEAIEAPTGAISPTAPPSPVAQSTRPSSGDWVVSETTSPIDYSPLVTAMIRSTSPVKDAPSTLTVRCRGQRTELVVHTEGVWRPQRGSEIQAAYQVNEQPAVGQRWTLSPDGKNATSKDDVIGLLLALPDGARLKINMSNQTSSPQEATFGLNGWDAVRKKIAKACRWSLTAEQASPQRR